MMIPFICANCQVTIYLESQAFCSDHCANQSKGEQCEPECRVCQEDLKV